MTRASSLLVLLFSLLSFNLPALASQEPWTEGRSAHFRVLTNGSKGDAHKVLREFEQMRWVFASRFTGARLESGAPLVVFATRDQATAKTLDPGMWKRMGEGLAGAFHHSWEKQYALVRLDTFGGEGAKEVVYHEYTHSILRLNSHWLPLWLNEGWAEFYGYTRFEEHKIYLGAPTERYRALRGKTPMPVQALISLRSVPADEQLFYTQSWALVHYLTYGAGMENGKRLGRFYDLLQQGTPQIKAFQDVFGDFKAIDKGLASYMQQPTFVDEIMKDPPQIDDKAIAFRTLTVAESEAELGGFHLWTGDHAGARTLVEQALKDDPKLGLAHENMGFLDFDDGKDAEAATEFKQAVAIDPKLYLSIYAGTMLSPLPNSNIVTDMNTFGATMGKVLQINPQFAPAYVQLARLAVREGDLNSALIVSRKAEDLQPSLAGYHLLTGQILRREGKGADASSAAKFVADRWAGPDHNEAVELWNSVLPGQRPAGEFMLELAPKDTQTARGRVKSTACSDTSWTLVVDTDDDSGADKSRQLLTFHSKSGFPIGYSDTIWYGADHFSPCHHLEGLRTIVYYHAPTDTTYAGDVAEVELRDDLPESLPDPSQSAKP